MCTSRATHGLKMILAYFLVDRDMSRGVFRGVSGLRKTIGSLSADGWGCISGSVGCVPRGIPALQPSSLSLEVEYLFGKF